MLQDPQTDATSPLDGLAQAPAFTEAVEWVHRILNFTLFQVADQDLTVITVFLVGVIIVLAWWMSHTLQRAADRAFRRRGVVDKGTTAVVKRLLHYAVMAMGLVIAIQQIGINLSALFAAGAIFAVAIGFAMQNIAENFVSGLILLVERVIKPGDIVEVEGQVVRVLKMGIRTTVARTRDEEEIIIPNAALVQSKVKNFTLGDWLFRVRVDVGVSYDSDMAQVREALERVATGLEGRLADQDPVILLTDFGDSSVDWEVSIWCDDAWRSPRIASRLRENVWWELKDAGVVIAYPQLDLHLDPPVERAISRLPRPA